MASGDLAQWTRFWQQGHITTFGASKARNYGGAVREFWINEFRALPSGARILDIATGNGAIATLAVEAGDSLGKDFFVAATDLAEIKTELQGTGDSARLRRRIRFGSHVSCERQPFPDGSFDCVTSQFGFEYSDLDRTVAEIHRVLAPGGRFLAISHHAESRLIRRSREELAVYRSALEEFDLFGQLRALLSALGDLSAPGADVARALAGAKPLSRAFNAAMDSFRQRHAGQECMLEIVGAVSRLARSARSTAHMDLLESLATSELEFCHARSRLQDMVTAALGPERVVQLEAAAMSVGFEVFECGEFFSEDGRLAGWRIHIR